MRVKILLPCIIGVICVLLTAPLAASSIPSLNSTQEDSVKKKAPDYTDVNVTVNTEWGSSDNFEGVNVYVVMKNGKTDELIMSKEAHQECCIKLISGVEVKIFDPKTGKVLKRYKP